MNAYLYLADGSIFQGTRIGAACETLSEIVFNTSMTGYQEILTDPSYAGQSVVMTYPLIGNYGTTPADRQSGRPWASSLIVRSLCRTCSNFRAESSLNDYLVQNRIPGIEGIDTRALTRILRQNGTMNGCVSTVRYEGDALAALYRHIRNYRVKDAVPKVSSKKKQQFEPFRQEGSHFHVALLDLGVKRNIIWSLQQLGCLVTVFPHDTSAENIIASDPDGILLSNGPGDPKENPNVIREIAALLDKDVPIFAICLGHQLTALAAGGNTFRLKYGHRGGNHPVKDLTTGRTYITSQNHGYAVDASSLDPALVREAFRNVNDGTNEGLVFPGKRILTVQFHPEACPGPQDSGYLFREFLEMMRQYRREKKGMP